MTRREAPSLNDFNSPDLMSWSTLVRPQRKKLMTSLRVTRGEDKGTILNSFPCEILEKNPRASLMRRFIRVDKGGDDDEGC